MSIFGKLLRGNVFDNPQVPINAANVSWFLDMFGGGRSDSNEVVTPLTAMQTSTVFACVRILSEQVGKHPLRVFEVTAQGKQLAFDHELFDLLELAPNPEMTSMTMRQAVTAQQLLWGNGYIEVVRNGAGKVSALYPRGAWATKPVRKNGQLVYETTDGGKLRCIDAADMLHIPHLSLDGKIGLSPISQARQSIGMHLAMDKFGARFFGNYATPKLAIRTDKAMRPEDKTAARADWEALQSGSNQHRVAILDNGMQVQQLSIPPEDAQFLESRAYTKREICALYGVPPQMVADLEKAAKSNVEQQGIEFLQYTLAPLLNRWTQEIRRKLLPRLPRTSKRFTVGFDVRELLRPDAASRQAYYQSGIQNGFLRQNEVREMEDLNPYEGGLGWEPAIQLNMQPLGNLLAQEPVGAPAADNQIQDEEQESGR